MLQNMVILNTVKTIDWAILSRICSCLFFHANLMFPFELEEHQVLFGDLLFLIVIDTELVEVMIIYCCKSLIWYWWKSLGACLSN